MSEPVTTTLLDPVNSLNIPAWLFWVSFLGSLVFTLLGVVKIFFVALKSTCLELRLTKEIFIRISEYGECLFPNIVIIARNGDVETKDISFELAKMPTGNSTTEKKYRVTPLFLGDRVAGEGPMAGNNFYTSSPLFFFEPGVPKRLVLLTVVEDYKDNLSEVLRQFEIEIIQLKNSAEEKTIQGAKMDNAEVLKNFLDVCNRFSSKLQGHIQLESGNYTMTAIIKYQALGGIRNRIKEAKSSISFEVRGDFKSLLEWKIGNTLQQRGRQLLTDQASVMEYPMYTPENIREI